MTRFPHLTANGNKSEFPDVSGVNVYAYDNEFDYSRYDHVQMDITLCRVPWDMGEAHVGNRTISGIGNVVDFGSKKKRDAWFASLSDSECYRFATKYKQLHRDNAITVPVPYDVASTYNYVFVQYEPFASEGDLIEYEQPGGFDSWCWFVREVEFLAPNATRLHLLNDAWQTFIYDIDIPYMFLERGHYAMSQVNASNFLRDPINTCEWLLSPEENAPDVPHVATSTHEHVFNSGNMYAVFAISSNALSDWGNKGANTWHVPANQPYAQGVPSMHYFATDADNLSSLLSEAAASVPQFLQSVQCIFFASLDLIRLENRFTFCGEPCYTISASYQHSKFHALSKDDFGYPARYAEIAKLYTYPYALIILSDSEGNEVELRVEDTNGSIELDYCLSLSYPWLHIDCAVTSVGKSARRSVSFSNVSTRNMPIKGNWFELLQTYEIPTFGVIESAAKANDHATHFDRIQQAYAADNAQANANASASTMKANADASADNLVANASLQIAAETASTNRSNQSASTDTTLKDDLNTSMALANNVLSELGTASQIAAQEMQATIGAATSVASGVIGGIASGNPVSAAASIGNGIIGAAGTIASTNVATGLTSTNAILARSANTASAIANNTNNDRQVQNQTDTASDITDIANDLTDASTANTAATQKANATRDQATQLANAARDRDTISHAIANQIAQRALDAPLQYGDFANGDHATTRPLAMFSNVVTQDAYTVRKFGDDFLRYGYTLNRQIDFDGTWCIMPKFTYWRLTDFWVQGLSVPDMYVDKIRFFLFGGVTVWRKPEDIGRTSIYDNVEGR